MGKTVLLPPLSRAQHCSASCFPSPLGLPLHPSMPWEGNLLPWRGSGCNAAPLSDGAQRCPRWSWPCHTNHPVLAGMAWEGLVPQLHKSTIPLVPSYPANGASLNLTTATKHPCNAGRASLRECFPCWALTAPEQGCLCCSDNLSDVTGGNQHSSSSLAGAARSREGISLDHL